MKTNNTKSEKGEIKSCCKIDNFKSSPRTEDQIKTITSRLSRVAGQVNGIKKMVEDNRYCLDLLIQISACKKALESVALMIFEDHIKTCVAEKIKSGDENIVSETIDVFKKMI